MGLEMFPLFAPEYKNSNMWVVHCTFFCVSLSVRVCSTGHVRHCDKQTSRRQEQCFAPARIEPQIQGEDGGWDGVFDQSRGGGL